MNPLGPFAQTIFARTYAIDQNEDWFACSRRVAKFVANGDLDLEERFFNAISERKFLPGGRYLAQAGRDIPQLTNCFLIRAEDSREGWANLLSKHMLALSTGGGVGTDYSEVRESGLPIKRFGGKSSGPIALMKMVNEVARHVMAGGKRRSALWAGLNWKHGDVDAFVKAKNWSTQIKALKEGDFNFPAALDMTNISVNLDDDFFKVIKSDKGVQEFYYGITKNMCKTGEPGFSVNLGAKSLETLRNPCCEVVSADDSDTCNLGSVNLSRINSLDEFEEIVRLGVEFLYLGTIVGYMPHSDYAAVRDKNRRIGLGLMGIHEWCIKNNLKYEPSGTLGRWLSTWAGATDDQARKVAKKYAGNIPIATRAIAPTGTISIIGETTSGIEPIFCRAYKRRFLDSDQKWKYSYVIDPTTERLVNELGVDPDEIEDCYSLSTDVERRISMQAFVQDFVDQAISSTINIPEWGEPGNNNSRRFGEILLKYLPRLRGITVYPDGARAGQPITPIKYETAKKHKDVIYEESDERCAGGVCGA
jgi:ribonucleoside-diphosphate reductase alpha chain